MMPHNASSPPTLPTSHPDPLHVHFHHKLPFWRACSARLDECQCLNRVCYQNQTLPISPIWLDRALHPHDQSISSDFGVLPLLRQVGPFNQSRFLLHSHHIFLHSRLIQYFTFHVQLPRDIPPPVATGQGSDMHPGLSLANLNQVPSQSMLAGLVQGYKIVSSPKHFSRSSKVR